jgi:hypothetical protein
MVDRPPTDAKRSAACLVSKSTVIERKLTLPMGAHTAAPELTACYTALEASVNNALLGLVFLTGTAPMEPS